MSVWWALFFALVHQSVARLVTTPDTMRPYVVLCHSESYGRGCRSPFLRLVGVSHGACLFHCVHARNMLIN